MENFANNLRECTISHLNGNQINIEYEFFVGKFIYYMDAYCAELKKTQGDILNNDKMYDSVFSLFNSVIIKKQLNLELV